MSKNISTYPHVYGQVRGCMHVLLRHLLHTGAQGAVLARWEEPESMGPGGGPVLCSTSQPGPISCLAPFLRPGGRGHLICAVVNTEEQHYLA